MLSFQFIYAGKTERSLPGFTFLDGFCLAFNQKHWCNETETIRLIEEKSLLVWDAFKVQSVPKVIDTLSSYGLESVIVPKNTDHLLHLLDLTTNSSFKKYEKWAFSEYFTFCVLEALTNDPD